MKMLLDYQPFISETSKDLRAFISNTKDCLFSLESLGLPVEHWDYILLFQLQTKIPSTTLVRWEEELGSSRDIPKFESFLSFLESRFRTLEMIEAPSKEIKKSQKTLHTKNNNSNIKVDQKTNYSKKFTKNPQSKNYSAKLRKNIQTCAICKQMHATAHCIQFKNNPVHVRRQLANQYQLCFNCLGSSHTIDVCYSTKTCIYCKQPHHSLLHIHESNNNNSRYENTAHLTTNIQQIEPSPLPIISQAIQHSNSFYASSDGEGVRILGTALIRIVNTSGYTIIARALLDSGADDNYITEATVQTAGLKKYTAAAAITGLNDVMVGSTEFKTNFRIESLDGSFQYDSSASIVEKITSKMPSKYVDPENFGFLNNLSLADPHFNHPGKIQLLLGVSFIVRIRKPGLKRFRELMAEQTLLGWVVMGQAIVESNISPSLTRNVLLTKSISNTDLSKQIQQFFEIEEFAGNIPHKPEDALCEAKFLNSIRRCPDVKLSMELPFREENPIIGASRHIAMRRFFNLEKKLEQNPNLKQEYHKTFTDYIKEGHMVPSTEAPGIGCEYFLPHHAVIKDSSTTTKVRVVFDGSCKSSDSTSLNDHLLTGPKLQIDIRNIFFN